MKYDKTKSIKPRSTRFTQEQEKIFAELEERGINISQLIREGATMMINQRVIFKSELQGNAI